MAYGDTGVLLRGGRASVVGERRRGLQAVPATFERGLTSYSTPTIMLPCSHLIVGSPGVRPKCILAQSVARGEVDLNEVNAATGANFRDAADLHDNVTPVQMLKWITMPPGMAQKQLKPNRWWQDFHKGT